MKKVKLFMCIGMLMLLAKNAYAVVIPIPIPMGGYSASPELWIALWIALNLIFLTVFVLKSLVWFLFKNRLKKKEWTYFQYTIHIDDVLKEYVQNWNTMSFIGVNGIGLGSLILINVMKWIINVI
jgi:heme/copper-type cytochrome/quinol oxidase subunit 2